MIRRLPSLLVVLTLAIIAICPGFSQMTMGVVSWEASLTGANAGPGITTKGTGKAVFGLDFDKSTVDITIDTKNLQGAQKIELRMVKAPNDVNGPVVFTIYDSASDGPLPEHLIKKVTGADFSAVSALVSNGKGAVAVTTKAHPQAEAAGLVKMVKSYHQM